MASQTVVAMGTIICQECEKEIAAVENVSGVKIWYGICKDCASKVKEKKNTCAIFVEMCLRP